MIFDEHQSVTPRSVWTIDSFVYADVCTSDIHTVRDRGADMDYHGGFYNEVNGEDLLLGVDLAAGLVWWGERWWDRGGNELFYKSNVQGTLLYVTLSRSRYSGEGETTLKCIYTTTDTIL